MTNIKMGPGSPQSLLYDVVMWISPTNGWGSFPPDCFLQMDGDHSLRIASYDPTVDWKSRAQKSTDINQDINQDIKLMPGGDRFVLY